MLLRVWTMGVAYLRHPRLVRKGKSKHAGIGHACIPCHTAFALERPQYRRERSGACFLSRIEQMHQIEALAEIRHIGTLARSFRASDFFRIVMKAGYHCSMFSPAHFFISVTIIDGTTRETLSREKCPCAMWSLQSFPPLDRRDGTVQLRAEWSIGILGTRDNLDDCHLYREVLPSSYGPFGLICLITWSMHDLAYRCTNGPIDLEPAVPDLQ